MSLSPRDEEPVTMEGAEALIQCYRDAALQRYLMLPRAADREREAGGWRFFYAVDSNVVGYFIDPAKHAIKAASLRIGIGDIFQLDSLANQQRVAVLVADYPFKALAVDHPLIALSPISGEIAGLYRRYTEEYFSHAASSQPMSQEELAAKLEAIDFNHLSDVDEGLIGLAVSLDHPVRRAANRIHDIVSQNRIIGGDRVTEQSHSAAVASALRYASSVADMIRFAQLKQKWSKALHKVGKPSGSPTERDAEAMARLEHCNERLRNSGVKERLLYITGDSYLLEAAEFIDWEGESGRKTFASAFLRHPRAFLDEPEVLRPSDEALSVEGQTLFGWLIVLLGRVEEISGGPLPRRGDISFSDTLKAIIRQVAYEDQNSADRILEKWRTFTAQVLDASLAPRSRVEQLLSLLRNSDAIEAVQTLRSELEGEIALAWTRVFYVTAGARFALEVAVPDQPNGNAPLRETPKLIFESRPALSRFLTEAERWLDEGNFAHQIYEELRQAVCREDQSSYGDYIGHAYLFAQQGQWRTGGILAGMASVKIGNVSEYIGGESNGRESSYLEAYCGRLTSQDVEMLNDAQRKLERAVQIEQAERDYATQAGRFHEAVSERFEAEALVFVATRALYKWNGSRSPSVLQATAEELLPRFLELANRIVVRLSDLPETELDVSHDVGMVRAALLSVLGRCYRSSLGLRFQIGDFGEQSRRSWEQLEEHCGGMRANQFAHFLALVGNVVFSPERSITARMRLLASLQRSVPRPVMPYDRARYQNILSHVQDHLSRLH